jgi:hypothetical protein
MKKRTVFLIAACGIFRAFNVFAGNEDEPVFGTEREMILTGFIEGWKTENLDAVIEFCTENGQDVSPYTTAFRRENRDILGLAERYFQALKSAAETDLKQKMMEDGRRQLRSKIKQSGKSGSEFCRMLNTKADAAAREEKAALEKVQKIIMGE